jgi:hypothetical protein
MPLATKPGAFAGEPALTEVLETLTNQARNELGDVMETLFFIGDGLQRAAIDGCFNLLAQQEWRPKNVLRLSCGAARRTVQLSRLLLPDQATLAWQELCNKLEVFILVKNLPSILGLPSNRFLPLPELLKKAYAVSAFASLWAVEGLGNYYAGSYWEHKGTPRGLLSEEHAPVPSKSLLMLHAGMGLSFADRMLRNLTSQALPTQIRSALESFLLLCQTNSRPGYIGAAIESLGLVTRDFHPDLLPGVEQQLRHVGPEFLGHFWHGVGRALYFSREYFLPVLRTVWSGVDREARSAPDKLSAVAGLTWAVTLVNMRQPAIMENVVRSYVEHSDLAEGFTNGVVSSIIVRTDSSPDAPFTSSFFEHRPNPYYPELMTEWERYIAAPSRVALSNYYPMLKQRSALDQVFRYQNLGAVVSSLQGVSTSAAPRPLKYSNC